MSILSACVRAFTCRGVDCNGRARRVAGRRGRALVRVLRLGVGDEVEVFDGRGGLWRAEVVQAGKKSAAVRALEPLPPARELGVAA